MVDLCTHLHLNKETLVEHSSHNILIVPSPSQSFIDLEDDAHRH